MQELPAPDHFFRFDVHTFPAEMERISVSEFNDGEEAMLKRNQFERISSGAEHIELYQSSWTNYRYLAIVREDRYRFIFYLQDDETLFTWKRRYGQFPPALLAQQLLPPPAKTPEYITIPMNMRAMRGR